MMNALIGVRNNGQGQLNPTSDARAQVSKQLATVAAARQGIVARDTSPLADLMVSDAVASDGDDGRTVSGATLDKDAFLQLLVLQMQNQDPLEPMNNGDMLAQLAQFSSLEAQTNLNDSFVKLSGNVDQLNFISDSQMLGKYVEGIDINGQLQSGMVEGIHLDGSLVVLTVDGEFMSMAGVIRVENAAPEVETETETEV
ncbi:MAG: flagellar hook capping FlgD N-terminal domain-containing protein [Candidatus Hydrogenedentota bacterium]